MSQNPGVAGSGSGPEVVSTKTSLIASAPANATVGTSSAQVLASNATRLGLSIINTSTNVVSISFGASPAVLNKGITLTQYGSVYEMSEYDYTTASVNAIASAGSSNISIQEWT